MVIDGKRFAAELGRLVKYGYNLRVRDGEITIYTADWMFNGGMTDLPREVLAELVKHLGMIPQNCCLRVWKHKDDILTQDMLEEVFQAAADDFSDAPELAEIRSTGLTWGIPLYQTRSGFLLGVKLNRRLLGDAMPAAYACEDKSAMWADADSAMYFRGYRPEEQSAQAEIWRTLEGIQWCKWER